MTSQLMPAKGVEWRAVLRELHHDAYHLPAYVELEASRLKGAAVGFVHYEGDDVLLLPLVLRPVWGWDWQDAVSPYGYPGPVATAAAGPGFWRRALTGLREQLTAAGAVSCLVRLHPLLDSDLSALAEAGHLVRHGQTVSIDLQQTPEAIWSTTRGNHRTQINRARRNGRRVIIDDWSRLDDFVAAYTATMHRVDATAEYFFTPAYFQDLRAALGDAVHLALVEGDGAVHGGGIFFEQDGIVQYHLGATHDRHMREQPAKLMFDEVRRWAAGRDDRVLHLGGGVGAGSDSLFSFKAGFSDRRHDYATWRLVVHETAYATLIDQHHPGRAPDPDGFFPAYRRR